MDRLFFALGSASALVAVADSPLVNENTRRRVWEAAERLRFQPNRLARSLRRGATMAVGLVVPDVAAAFYSTSLKSAQDTLEAAGYHVLVLSTGRAAEREREALRTLRAHQVDGLILATSGGYEDIGVPAVFFDNVPLLPGAGAVAMDNEAGIRLLVEHLAGVHGHAGERAATQQGGDAVRRDRKRGTGPVAFGGAEALLPGVAGRVVALRQVQREGAAGAGPAHEPDLAAEQSRQLAADGEAEAGAAVLARGRAVGLLEGLEDDLLLDGRDADAGVRDREGNHLAGVAQLLVVG